MNQHEAPIHTLATIGHPGNNRYIFKNGDGVWRTVHDGKPVEPEDFRAGWEIVRLPG
jgi:hypothetical protein